MINLLPIEKREELSKDYLYRLILMGSIFFLVALLIFNVVLITFYFILISEKNQLEEQYNLVDTGGEAKENREIISGLTKDLNFLDVLNEENKSSDIFMRVVDSRGTGITIKELTHGPGEAESLRIVGNADTRNNFVSYLNILENEELFKIVESPISNLSKVEDINFSINILFKSDEN